MNDKNIFNSSVELTLRTLLVLSHFSDLNVDQIAIIDFKTTYGKYFGNSEYNLHGDNEFGLQEYGLRRQKISKSIKEGVLQGIITYREFAKKGFLYSLSTDGKSVVNNFPKVDLYFKEYNAALKNIEVPNIYEIKNFQDKLSQKMWGGVNNE
ncbi:ABC-three component system middle component 2 [Limosilactobacillus reuteri]|uniref:ABC-three component system middle component 2 n=1 Tax=Limosilactobacillus reuteri TaxID=1598 RepID=UPI00214C6B88|nr:ABC-three component system middle component 2 [Limosilactobacillus reuteri]MCR1862213.1 hypothetical protein [Limosilactobacillus reuteri]MCR1891870.1 hypothetical protein [Limosilactobacillus reuteri]